MVGAGSGGGVSGGTAQYAARVNGEVVGALEFEKQVNRLFEVYRAQSGGQPRRSERSPGPMKSPSTPGVAAIASTAAKASGVSICTISTVCSLALAGYVATPLR